MRLTNPRVHDLKHIAGRLKLYHDVIHPSLEFHREGNLPGRNKERFYSNVTISICQQCLVSPSRSHRDLCEMTLQVGRQDLSCMSRRMIHKKRLHHTWEVTGTVTFVESSAELIGDFAGSPPFSKQVFPTTLHHGFQMYARYGHTQSVGRDLRTSDTREGKL
jgi:hypothetical protein